jgi:hypothetical protein
VRRPIEETKERLVDVIVEEVRGLPVYSEAEKTRDDEDCASPQKHERGFAVLLAALSNGRAPRRARVNT